MVKASVLGHPRDWAFEHWLGIKYETINIKSKLTLSLLFLLILSLSCKREKQTTAIYK